MAWFSKKPKLSSTRNEILDLKHSVKFLNEWTFRMSGRVLQLEKQTDVVDHSNVNLTELKKDVDDLNQRVDSLIYILECADILEPDLDRRVSTTYGGEWRYKEVH